MQISQAVTADMKTAFLDWSMQQVNFRIASFYALLIALCTLAASPVPVTSWTPLLTNARAIDSAANRGDWKAAGRLSDDLLAPWTLKRPAVIHGLKGKAYAQSFDSSLKWVNSAIAHRNTPAVHQAVANAQKNLHELEERAPSA